MTVATKKPKLNENKEENDVFKVYVKNFSAAVIGFFFAAAKLPQDISPFAASFIGGAKIETAPFVFLGSAVSFFVFFPVKMAAKYFICAFFSLILRTVLLRKMKCENKSFAVAVMCCASTVLSSLIYISFSSVDFQSVLVCFCEAAIVFFSTLVYSKAFNVPVHIVGIKKLSGQETFYLLYTLCSFLLSFSSFTLGDISPARILVTVFLVFISQYKGVFISSTFAVACALSFSLVPSYSFLFPVYTLATVASGVFSSLGHYASAISFFLAATVAALTQGFDSLKLFSLLEVFIGSVIYAVIPVSKISLIESRIEKTNLSEDKNTEKLVSATLRNAAEKIENVSQIVENVSSRLDKIINPEINRVFSSLQQSVCFGCGKKKECWNKLFNETANDIMIISGLRQAMKAKTDLEERCIKPNALKRHIERQYADFVNFVSLKMKQSEMRGILSDQFLCIGDFLNEMAENCDNDLKEDVSRSRSIFSVLKDSDIDVLSVRYLTNASLPVRIEIEFYENIDELDFFKIQNILELTTSYKFKKPQVDLSFEGTKIVFLEKFTFKLVYGKYQIPLAESKICGDRVGSAFDERGNESVILSDGMGTGSRAAVDAAMTVSLFENLLSCGFSFENSLKVINLALIMKSTDESLSTVDALCVNLYSGNAVFYKAGATISFVRSDNKVRVIQFESMPIGIIRTLSFNSKRERLKNGDIVLLVSDGVTANDCGWINDEILAWSTNNMDDLARHIASLSKMRSKKETQDDITVVAIKVLKADF